MQGYKAHMSVSEVGRGDRGVDITLQIVQVARGRQCKAREVIYSYTVQCRVDGGGWPGGGDSTNSCLSHWFKTSHLTTCDVQEGY